VNLLGIRQFLIPRAVAEASLEVIHDAARHKDEAFVAWAGVVEGEALRFRRAIVPRQTAHKTPQGLLVTIDGQSLFDLGRKCHAHGELLAGQIHGHPDSAYHSHADDDLAIVTIAGGISIVVPDFAAGGLGGVGGWACFQLQADGTWEPVPTEVSVHVE
jgi:hypothetical protein